MTIPTRSTKAIEQVLRDMGFDFDDPDGFTMKEISGRCTFKKDGMNYPAQIMETSLPDSELDVRDKYGNKLTPDILAEAFRRMSRT